MSEDQLGKRERQILRAIYRLKAATVSKIRDELEDPPSLNAVRTQIQTLDEKGHLVREKRGREFVYSPRTPRLAAGINALQKVLETFFDNSIEEAISTHFVQQKKDLTAKDFQRLEAMIQAAKEKHPEA